MPDGYDVIGDIHGHAEELKALLTKLGYEERGGAYRHSTHTAIFIGDYIDRGPNNLEVVRIVRAMVDAGTAQAIMGNHEYNAIGFHTVSRTKPGAFLREHSTKNVEQHKAFLLEQSVSRIEAAEALDWFKTLPIVYEADGIQFAHAAWHQPTVNWVKKRLDGGYIPTEEFLSASFNKGTAEDKAIETLLKGPEYRLPDAAGSFKDKGGHIRNEVRLAWWNSKRPLDLIEGSVGVPKGTILPFHQIPDDEFSGYEILESASATFFGHYWMTGTPNRLATNIACVDYSVAKKGGHLCCYRWRGERVLKPENFVKVPSSAKD